MPTIMAKNTEIEIEHGHWRLYHKLNVLSPPTI